MKYLIMYDISDNRRLMKTFHILKKNGIRTQYSFFECSLTRNKMLDLFEQIKSILDEDEDKLFIIPINSINYENAIRIGNLPTSLKGVV